MAFIIYYYSINIKNNAFNHEMSITKKSLSTNRRIYFYFWYNYFVMKKINSFALTLTKTNYLFLSLSFLSFAVPFFLNSSQIITGTLVNTALFFSAYLLPKKYQLPPILLPSLGVLTRGVLFGHFTLFLVYFLPFIWLGNYLLIKVFKKTQTPFGILPAIFLSAFAKQALLLLSARLYFSAKIVPAIFLTSMGVIQLLTALLGGLIFYLIISSLRSRRKAGEAIN